MELQLPASLQILIAALVLKLAKAAEDRAADGSGGGAIMAVGQLLLEDHVNISRGVSTNQGLRITVVFKKKKGASRDLRRLCHRGRRHGRVGRRT